MTSFWIKIFLCPILILFAAYFIPGLVFSNLYQPIILGLIIAIIGVGMDYMWTIKKSLWVTTSIDFILFLFILESANMFRTIHVYFSAAFITSLLLATAEFFLHLYLIRSGKTTRTIA